MAAQPFSTAQSGRIETTGVPALLRAIEREKVSGELAFTKEGQRISLYFLFGQLYHSVWGAVVGVDAVSELLGWKVGTYTLSEGIVPAEASISDDVARILLADSPRHDAPADGGWAGQEGITPFDGATFDAAPDRIAPAPPISASDRIAPAPPGGGFYRTRAFALPAGEQMAASLVATGPELQQELQQLSDVGFTGYVLGSPDVDGYASIGMTFLKGRFVHAFTLTVSADGTVDGLITGDAAYQVLLNQNNTASRYYWFYEMTPQVMAAAISLLDPPTRYVNLEVRILRFKEVLRVLNEENVTGIVAISHTGPPTQQSGRLYGTRAYVSLYQGDVLGMWTYGNPKMVNDGALLQRFLSEPTARIDLHIGQTAMIPGMALEVLPDTGTQFAPVLPADMSVSATPQFSDDTRIEYLVLTVGRMEATWTQMRKKGRLNQQTNLLALGGFANEVIGLYETVAGRESSVALLNLALHNELQPYSVIFHVFDVAQGRVNMLKLLREYAIFADDNVRAAEAFFRDASRALKTLIRSVFQTYVRDMRTEAARWEGQDTFEVFLQEVVWKM